jgi:hypothetical protein
MRVDLHKRNGANAVAMATQGLLFALRGALANTPMIGIRSVCSDQVVNLAFVQTMSLSIIALPFAV